MLRVSPAHAALQNFSAARAALTAFFCPRKKISKKILKPSCYFLKMQYNGSEGEKRKGRQM